MWPKTSCLPVRTHRQAARMDFFNGLIRATKDNNADLYLWHTVVTLSVLTRKQVV